MRVAYRDRAREDIADINKYRSTEHSLEVAVRVEAAIRGAIATLAQHPELGTKTDYRLDVRRWPMTDYPYTIFYYIDRYVDTITIVRVVGSGGVHSLRRPPRL